MGQELVKANNDLILGDQLLFCEVGQNVGQHLDCSSLAMDRELGQSLKQSLIQRSGWMVGKLLGLFRGLG